MQSWKGSTRGGLWGYKFFIFSLRFLGLRFAYFILAFIVVYFAAFAPKATRSIYYYFRTIRKQPAFQSFINIFRNYYVFGQVILDKTALLDSFDNRFTYDFDGEYHLHELAKRKQGALLIGAHAGNWEIAGQLLERIDAKFYIVMLEAEHENIKKLEVKLSGKKVRYLHLVAKNIGVCPPGHAGEGKNAWLFVDEIMVE